MKSIVFVLAMAVSQVLLGQHVIHLVVDKIPGSHLGEDIFVSGNFNSWKPDDPDMKLAENQDGTYSIEIVYDHIPSDRVEFKFTRGTWQKSECTADGKLTGPRLLELKKNITLTCTIEGWRDDFPASTAGKNVHVLAEAFYMPQLDRHRKIWIYLPEDYEFSNKSYPVLYMHDGQHLFDEATSQGRIGPIEWAVDETLDARKNPGIVVAIDHHPDMEIRIPEYYYHSNSEYPQTKGKAYLEFIVNTLKPYVDSHYRTLKDRENTGILGSSLGGLISLYAGINYPEIFGRVGVFSPSIWSDSGHIETEIENIKSIKSIENQHYFFYSGDNENRQMENGKFVRMSDDVRRIIRLLKEKANPEIEHLINPSGRHGALYWREAFPVFYEWYLPN